MFPILQSAVRLTTEAAAETETANRSWRFSRLHSEAVLAVARSALQLLEKEEEKEREEKEEKEEKEEEEKNLQIAIRCLWDLFD